MARVLVVDDVQMMTMLINTRLRLEGHTCVTINSSKALLNPGDPRWDNVDVLICDLMMPEVSGLDVLETAKLMHPHIYRIALTAVDSSSVQIMDRARALADVVLKKPEDIELLATIVERAGTSDG